ncbi:MAG: DUF4249 family protein [Arcicella sp.]|nr:DUF4249 family protein [Arcicella sp.]
MLYITQILKKVGVLLSPFFLLSCQNLDSFEINTVKEPLIVIQANLIVTQSPKIYVGKLWGATAPRPKETFYRGADVELFENGKSVGKLFLKDTLYQNSNYIIKSNTNYVIKASVQGVKSVESEPVLIPADGVINNVVYLKNSPVNSTNNTIRNPALITVTFRKDDSVAGYGVQLLNYDKSSKKYFSLGENIDLGTLTFVKSPCLFDSYCANVDIDGNIGNFIYRGRTAYLSKCIDTEDKQVRFVTGSGFEENTRIIAILTATSQEGVELSRTTKIVEGFQAALTEPYPTYSNVKGGIGIVIGYNVTYKVLTIN